MKHISYSIFLLAMLGKLHASVTFVKPVVASVCLGEKTIEIDEKTSIYSISTNIPELSNLRIDESESLRGTSGFLGPIFDELSFIRYAPQLRIISGLNNLVTITADPRLLKKLTAIVADKELRLDLEHKGEISYVPPISYIVELQPEVLSRINSIQTNMNTLISASINDSQALSIELTGNSNHLHTTDKIYTNHLKISSRTTSRGLIQLNHVAASELTVQHRGTGLLAISTGFINFGNIEILNNSTVDLSTLSMDQLSLRLYSGFLRCNVHTRLFGNIYNRKKLHNRTKAEETSLLSFPS